MRKIDSEKYQVQFKTKREIGIEQIDYAINTGLPLWLVVADAGYEGEKFTQEIISRRLKFIIGVRTTTKISFNRKKRIDIAKYMETLTDDNFKIYIKNDKAYFYHVKTVFIRGIRKVKIVVSYKHGDEENVKCYITNLDNDEIIIKNLIKRWRIECFHRDAKQHLGLEAYQVRKGRGMQVVALAILIAYTLVILAARIIKTPVRPLKTIGETCRYLALIAYKGMRWIRKKMKNPLESIKFLKKHVFVKNAKV